MLAHQVSRQLPGSAPRCSQGSEHRKSLKLRPMSLWFPVSSLTSRVRNKLSRDLERMSWSSPLAQHGGPTTYPSPTPSPSKLKESKSTNQQDQKDGKIGESGGSVSPGSWKPERDQMGGDCPKE